jgi:hypothetical protein
MEYKKTCEYCGKEFTAKHKKARYCSDACKMHAYRNRKQTTKGA